MSRPAGPPAATNGDDADHRPPPSELRAGPGTGRMSTVGLPAERSKDFGGTARRLMARMAPQRLLLAVVAVLALASVTLVVLGPRILGWATDVIFDGLLGRNGATGIDTGRLHRLLYLALAVYVASYVLAYLQARLLAGIVQRTMFGLRAEVEAKLHRLPLGYVDRHARGDLLSRVTNDIDNVAQSLQQTLSQLLTSVLSLVGVLAHDVRHLAGCSPWWRS